MNRIVDSLIALNRHLESCPFDFAFIGGSVLSLLIDDKVADTIRVTKDVDIIADVRTRRDFHREERELEARGFKHDMSEDAPVCRWVVENVTVDVLPIREEVLGWKSRWFEEALRAARTIDVEGHSIKVVTAPYFVALKLEAFEDRGKRDFIASTDFEDVICLFNGRSSIVEEILAEPTLKDGIARKFREYLLNADLEDAVLGFVQTETNPESRYDSIMNGFRRLANSGAPDVASDDQPPHGSCG